VGGFDALIDWQKRYYDWLKISGKRVELIEYPNMMHGFYVFPDLPESSQFILQVKDFINNRVSNYK
jgi:acetyl esterase/lipase